VIEKMNPGNNACTSTVHMPGIRAARMPPRTAHAMHRHA
jgi:hypothetical protein